MGTEKVDGGFGTEKEDRGGGGRKEGWGTGKVEGRYTLTHTLVIPPSCPDR